MSLTFGRGPFAPQRGSGNVALPDHVLYWEPWPRRLRALLGRRTVFDTERAIALYQTGQMIEHYIPLDDVDTSVLSPAGQAGHGARRWDVLAGDRKAANAVTGYAGPSREAGGPPLEQHGVRVPLQGRRAALAHGRPR